MVIFLCVTSISLDKSKQLYLFITISNTLPVIRTERERQKVNSIV